MRDGIIRDNRANEDGVDRRGFLKCMAWAGTGVLWAMSGGVLRSYGLSQIIDRNTGTAHLMPGHDAMDFSFVQISDSHIGFQKEANPDVVGTLNAAIAKINALAGDPSFIIHTGDLSHLSKDAEFDTLDQVLKSATPDQVYFVPGEHDVIGDDGKRYLQRYGKGTKGNGWYSFDIHGTHFVGLVNVLDLKPGGLGKLGHDQLDWLEDDLKDLTASTPLVIFAHVPLWSVYPDWGWGTDDAAEALSYVRRFGSVTVLNGHIHQVLQKVEGNITFHTAMSTAFPQPVPGAASSPGPMKVPADRLRSILGLTSVNLVHSGHSLAITDMPLAAGPASSQKEESSEGRDQRGTKAPGPNQVNIDNFTFVPQTLTVSTGTTVTWTNSDDVPHTVVSTKKLFSSPVLDTNDRFTWKFGDPGRYDYFCSIHPHMTGTVEVK